MSGMEERYESMREDWKELVKIFKQSEENGSETLTQEELDEVRYIIMTYDNGE